MFLSSELYWLFQLELISVFEISSSNVLDVSKANYEENCNKSFGKMRCCLHTLSSILNVEVITEMIKQVFLQVPEVKQFWLSASCLHPLRLSFSHVALRWEQNIHLNLTHLSLKSLEVISVIGKIDRQFNKVWPVFVVDKGGVCWP